MPTMLAYFVSEINRGLFSANVSGLVIQNMVFTSCMAKAPISSGGTLYLHECSNVTMRNLTFEQSYGVLAMNIIIIWLFGNSRLGFHTPASSWP